MKPLILCFILFSLHSSVFADEIVTLKSGEKAILLDSGRWSIMVPREQQHTEASNTLTQVNPPIQGKQATDTYTEVTLGNIKQDIDELNGEKIKIQTYAEMYNFILMLKQDDQDATPLTVNINGLSHDEKNHLKADCNNGCTVTVYGRVGDVLHDELGIIADKIEW